MKVGKRHPLAIIYRRQMLIGHWIRQGKSLDYIKKWLGLNFVQPIGKV